MKKMFILLFAASTFIACKNQAEETETETETAATTSETAQTFRGEFIYVDEGAVLNGSDFIYGVELNETAKDLAAQVEEVKEDKYDMVPVIVSGVLKDNPQRQETGEGWEKIVSISEILYVSDRPAAADIKIKDTKN